MSTSEIKACPRTIEEIFPLTIVMMRYGGKIVICNTIADNSTIQDLQESEEPMYDIDGYITKWSCFDYGYGDTIWQAFEDYQKRILGEWQVPGLSKRKD